MRLMPSSTGPTLVAVLVVCVPLLAAPQESEEATAPRSEGLAEELLTARKALILDTTMNFSLSNEFRSALEAWNRHELVSTPDEADVCFALSTRQDFTREELSSGDDETTEEADDGMRPRAKGTMRVIDKLYLKVFVPGEADETLWRDEIDAGLETPAAELVERLRQRIAAAEESTAPSSADDS